MFNRIMQTAFIFFLCLLSIPCGQTVCQTASSPSPKCELDLKSFETGSTASLRGLSVVNQNVVWASGSGGKVIRTIDGGKSWKEFSIPDSAEIEFRDIEAFDEMRAVILGAGSPAKIYTTDDGGTSWKQRYKNDDQRVFFDAFSFWNRKSGIAFSDPLDGRMFLVKTADGGVTWKQSAAKNCPPALTNEAGFAASGTCLVTFGKQHVWIGFGGKPAQSETKFSRVAMSADSGTTWAIAETTIPRSESAGIFSLAMIGEKVAVAVGGDYKQPELAKNSCSKTTDGGKTWIAVTKETTGFRSCIAVGTIQVDEKNSAGILLATGTNGTDLSVDQGSTWARASDQGFHALQFAKGTNVCWASGGSGIVAKFTITTKN